MQKFFRHATLYPTSFRQFLAASAWKFYNPAQVTSTHKHFCCPCAKWADCVYSLKLVLLTGLDARACFLQLSKSSKAHPIRKKQRVDFEKFLYDEEQRQFSKQKCGKCSQQMNEKVKKNPKIPPVDVIGGRFKV